MTEDRTRHLAEGDAAAAKIGGDRVGAVRGRAVAENAGIPAKLEVRRERTGIEVRRRAVENERAAIEEETHEDWRDAKDVPAASSIDNKHATFVASSR